MKPTRRSLLTGISALAVTPGCAGKLEKGGVDTGSPTPPEPAPEREAEPAEVWSPAGEADWDAFPSGVQVGDVRSDSALVSVWMTAEAGEIEIAAADDEDWVSTGERIAVVREGASAQIEVLGLDPDTAYCIVAHADGKRSGVTRFRTALASDGFRQITIGATSCLHSNRPWRSMSEVAAVQPDVFMLLGDTVYADGAIELEDYRWHWRRALTVQGLIDISSQTSLIATWDDHEVTNDFAGLNIPPDRVEAALTAFREAIPQRKGPVGGIWRKLSWGRAADIFVLDGRGERDGDAQYISREQMDWLKTGLLESEARFKLIMNSVPVTDYAPIFAQALIRDRWQGYPAQRSEILDHIVANDVEGVLWITGDFHMCTASRIDPLEGVAADLWEVMVGPGGSFLNIAAKLVEPNDQFPVIFAEYCSTLIHLDPGTGTVRVEWVADDGSVWDEITLAL